MESDSQQIKVFEARGLSRTCVMGEVKVHALRDIDLDIYFPLTLAWMLLLDPHFGFLNAAAQHLPFVTGPILNPYSFWGIVWVHLGTGGIWLNVMLLTPVFRRLGASLEEAARVSGANTFSTLWRITFPVLSPMILAIATSPLPRAWP